MENTQGDVPRQEAPKEADIVGKKFDEKDIAENKYVAMLSYLGVLFLVPLLLKKESAFSQFHAKQGLIIAIGWLIGGGFFWIPLVGWGAMLILLVVNIVALVKTYDGESWEIPLVKDAVKKLNI